MEIKKIFRNKIISKFGIYFFGQALLSVINFFMLPLYSHYITTDEFGVYSIILMFITVSSILIDTGLTSTFSIKFYKLNKTHKTNFLYNILFYYLMIGCVVSLILIYNNNLLNNLLSISVSYTVRNKVILIMLLTVFVRFLTNIFIIEQNAIKYVIVTLIRAISFAGFNLIFLIKYQMGYISYINATLISLGIVFFVEILYIMSNYKININGFKFKNYKELFKVGTPLVFHNLANIIVDSGDKYLLNMMGTASMVGLYSMGYKFGAFFLAFVVSPFGQVVWPILAKSFSEDKEKYKKNVANFLYVNLILTSVFLSTIYLVLDLYYRYFINQEYWESYNIIIIILVSMIIYSLSQNLTSPIMLREKTFYIPLITLSSGIVNVLINFWLIPDYGIYGAAYATLITYIFMIGAVFIISQKLEYIRYRYKNIIKFTIVSTVFFSIEFKLSGVVDFSFSRFLIKVFVFIIFIVVTYYINRNEIRKYKK